MAGFEVTLYGRFCVTPEVTIVKKKRMKATGSFLKFAFSIEASDDDKDE